MVTEFDKKAISHSFGVRLFHSVIEYVLPSCQHLIAKRTAFAVHDGIDVSLGYVTVD